MSHGNLVPFTWHATGLDFTFEFFGDSLRFRSVLPHGAADARNLPQATNVSGLETSIHCTGEDIPDHHGAKFTGGAPGIQLIFAGSQESRTARGKRLTLTHRDPATGLEIRSVYETVGDIPVVRRWTQVENRCNEAVGLEYVSSAMLNNFADPDTFQDDLRLHFRYNSWQAEAQWRSVRLADAGLIQNGNFTVSGAQFSTLGSWPWLRTPEPE